MAALAAGRGGSTMPDDREEGEAVDGGQQVRVRVEGRRVEVLLAGRHDPQALGAQALVLGEVVVAHRSDRDVRRRPGRGRSTARASSWSGAPLM